MPTATTNTPSTIWSLADTLRGTFKAAEYQRVILPFMVLRRLDCALQATKQDVISEHKELKPILSPNDLDISLRETSGYPFYNTSKFDFPSLRADSDNVERNLKKYLSGYSKDVQDIVQHFHFDDTVRKLVKHNLLYALVDQFAALDLHPDVVTNTEMGYIFEELLRKFSEMVNETAGEHYTPRSVVSLATRLAIAEDPNLRKRVNQITRIYDPTCGTGGMLTAGEEYLANNVSKIRDFIELYGQELNDESYAIAKADLLVKGYDPGNITLGNTLTSDQLPNLKATYALANPPYGVSWAADRKTIEDEAATKGYAGRFGAGTPPVSDGSLLFVQHIVSKLDPAGGRAAIVLNSSPLTNGDAGSSESNIRKWLLENDLIEAVVALPTDMFYNTGIATYIWVLSNKKAPARRGKVQLIDARDLYTKMRKALGSKRKEMEPEHIDAVIQAYREMGTEGRSRMLPVEDFFFQKVTVERPKRDENGEIVVKKGHPVPDTALRDTERVPWGEDPQVYLEREVHPWVPDAWIDPNKTKIGVQVPFEQNFYVPEMQTSVAELDASLEEGRQRLEALLREMGSGSR